MIPWFKAFAAWVETSDNPVRDASESTKHSTWPWMRAAFRAGWEAHKKQDEEGNVFE